MSRIALVLLAAGQGRRFGGNKLQAELSGRPLIEHAAEAARQLACAWRFAVVADDPAPDGFAPVRNADPAAGQGYSLALGVAAAAAAGAEGVLVLLADMPCVTVVHLRAVLARFAGARTIVASTDGTRRLPPVLFGSTWFAALERPVGDQGARALLAQADLVAATPAVLRDVDCPADLCAIATGDVAPQNIGAAPA